MTNTDSSKTYTDAEAFALLESEGFEGNDIAAVFDSMVDAGFELDQPDEGYLLTEAEVTLLREQLEIEVGE